MARQGPDASRPGCWALSLQSPTWETGEKLDKRVIYTMSSCKEQAHHTANKGQCWPECKNVSALNLAKTSMVKKIKADSLEKLVGYLVPAFQCGDFSFITNFLGSYRDVATTQQVLDLLFTKYGCILPYSKEDGGPLDQLKNAISFILSTWLYEFSEDFCQPPDFLALHVLVAYLQLNLPGSELEQFAQLLLKQHEQVETIQAEAEAPAPVPEPGLQPDFELDFPAAPLLPPDRAPDTPPGLKAAQIIEASLKSAVVLVPAAAQEVESQGVSSSPKPSSPSRKERPFSSE